MSRKHSITFDPEEGLTRQEFQRECNINHIMARAQRDGVISHVSRYAAEYGDFATFDFTTAMSMLADANDMFLELPSRARAHFDNDAGKFLDYVNGDPDLEVLRDLGLTVQQEEQIKTSLDAGKSAASSSELPQEEKS